MIYRWNLAEATPIRSSAASRSAARRHLPPAAPRVTARRERARVIEGRREGVRRRFARPA